MPQDFKVAKMSGRKEKGRRERENESKWGKKWENAREKEEEMNKTQENKQIMNKKD
jgi:hypothetical protein